MTVHGAQFSDSIVSEIRDIAWHKWPDFWGRPKLWDPYAGKGVKLEQIAYGPPGQLGMDYGGTEIEASFIESDRIIHGSATDPTLYPTTPFAIVTSPVYPNGMADSWKMSDGSKRHTYRSWVTQNEGKDRELDDENMGRYGYRGTNPFGRSKKRAAYWKVANDSVACWGRAEAVILNVSDFHTKHGIERFTADWVQLMASYGWHIVDSRRVKTPRNGEGANREKRVEFESVLVFERAPTSC